MRETRRPRLATIVGSGLAVVAAGSLLAFSSLAEQAGLEGLATGGIRPAAPASRPGRAITLPAPVADADRSVHDGVRRVVDETIRRDGRLEPPVEATNETPTTVVAEAPAPPEITAPVAAPSPPPETETKTEKDWDGGKYDGSLQAKKKQGDEPTVEPSPDDEWSHEPSRREARGHEKKSKKSKARSDDAGGPAKPSKMAKAKGKEARRLEQAAGDKDKSNGKGHAKHEHENGKGKGHSKHGH